MLIVRHSYKPTNRWSKVPYSLWRKVADFVDNPYSMIFAVIQKLSVFSLIQHTIFHGLYIFVNRNSMIWILSDRLVNNCFSAYDFSFTDLNLGNEIKFRRRKKGLISPNIRGGFLINSIGAVYFVKMTFYEFNTNLWHSFRYLIKHTDLFDTKNLIPI